MSLDSGSLFWTNQAWIDGAWKQGVVLQADANGCWVDIQTGVHEAPLHARKLSGSVLPGIVNAHSHAFQRAFAGLSERRESDSDDFWSWRDRMYGAALRITPEQLQTVAAQLYAEMLQGGYTQVCEFHYLHHSQSGAAYLTAATMGHAIESAAHQAGIGLTHLPVLYERAGFTQPALRDDQRRFSSNADLVHELMQTSRQSKRRLTNSGVAIHSLRAASTQSIEKLLKKVAGEDIPIHIHISEQMAEVNDCIVSTGKRPIAWLCDRHAPDARWHLVHATHADKSEIEQIAKAESSVVICPSTEGNLGDGFANIPFYLSQGVPLSIGSDSHVSRQWPEELRWLEYGQRMLHQRRNVAAAPAEMKPSTAERLFGVALDAGAKAAGQKKWGLVKGARADLLVINSNAQGLLGIPQSHALDATVFASGETPFSEVYVAAQCLVQNGRHVRATEIADSFRQTMNELWASAAI